MLLAAASRELKLGRFHVEPRRGRGCHELRRAPCSQTPERSEEKPKQEIPGADPRG